MSAPRRRVFVWNAVFGYFGLGFTLARNVLFVPIYLHYIELGEYGAWLATGGALVQLLITDFGLSGVISQRVAALSGAGDRSAIRALTAAGMVNAALLAVGLTAFCSLLGLALPATQGLSREAIARVSDCFMLALVANGVGIVSVAALAVVRGAQRATAAGVTTLVAELVGVVVTLTCLFSGLGLYGIA